MTPIAWTRRFAIQTSRVFRHGVFFSAILAAMTVRAAAEPRMRTEHFDTDPRWDARNNRLVEEPGRETVQQFGYTSTRFGGGSRGEVGGALQTAAERAYYAKALPAPLSFEDRLSASGRLAFAPGRATGPFLIGFFDQRSSFGWRTPNSLALRIDGRGDVLHVHMEFCTSKWRAGAGVVGSVDPDTGRLNPVEFPAEGLHEWSFDYDPAAADGRGAAAFTFDGHRAEMAIGDSRIDGSTFDRFGLFNVMKSSDNRVEVYLDDLTVNGERDTFDADPGWVGEGNRHTYGARIVRPWFDFGFSDTNYAGQAPGELGGTVFRGDYRYESMLAYYGDRTATLTLNHPLEAHGRVCLLRSISDAGVLIGWFNSDLSLQGGTDKSTIPQDFLGAFIEGPSSEGFWFRPAYRIHGEEGGAGRGPHIYPDNVARDWTIRYSPGARTLTVSLDGEESSLEIPESHIDLGATFNRFGIITTQIDGNYEIIYFDDLNYTVEQ